MIMNRCCKLNSIKPKIRKTFCLAVLIMFMFISLSGCKTKDPSVKTIGISAPSNDIQRWAVETVLMRDKLREKGYEVIIQYASSDISMQISQIENLIVAHQSLLSMGFSRQEYWGGLPFPAPGDLPDPGIEAMSPISPALAGGFFTTAPHISILIQLSVCSFGFI